MSSLDKGPAPSSTADKATPPKWLVHSFGCLFVVLTLAALMLVLAVCGWVVRALLGVGDDTSGATAAPSPAVTSPRPSTTSTSAVPSPTPTTTAPSPSSTQVARPFLTCDAWNEMVNAADFFDGSGWTTAKDIEKATRLYTELTSAQPAGCDRSRWTDDPKDDLCRVWTNRVDEVLLRASGTTKAWRVAAANAKLVKKTEAAIALRPRPCRTRHYIAYGKKAISEARHWVEAEVPYKSDSGSDSSDDSDHNHAGCGWSWRGGFGCGLG